MFQIEMSLTAYYIIILSISILLNIICPFLNIYWYFAFSIKQIKENHQYWRLFTNYLVKPSRHVNFGTFMDLVAIYMSLNNIEVTAKYKRKYSQAIMTILIMFILNLLSTLFLYYKYDIKESRSLIHELYYSLLAISSYKYPNEKLFLNFVPIKKKFAPIGIILMRICINKDISMDILKAPLIGFFTGFLFCIITKKLKVKYVPQFLKTLLREPSDEERKIQKQNMIELLKLQKKMKKIQKLMKKREERELEDDNNNNHFNHQQGNVPFNHNFNYNINDLEMYFKRNEDDNQNNENNQIDNNEDINDDIGNNNDDGQEKENNEINMEKDENENEINEDVKEKEKKDFNMFNMDYEENEMNDFNRDNNIDKKENEMNEEVKEKEKEKNDFNMDMDNEENKMNEINKGGEEKDNNFHYKND
jgi:hypothetical protein